MTIALGFLLTGCEARFRFGTGDNTPLQIPPQDRVIEKGDETIIEPPPPQMCQARARHFRGTVSIPCEDIARQTSP